ncbi:MAG: hypothetical protein DMF03_12830 [Verrucomicrobia bacterium]|nr:MAG: hypothetical protein DMF03_12830 [Verrucomicrobiota bacterium]
MQNGWESVHYGLRGEFYKQLRRWSLGFRRWTRNRLARGNPALGGIADLRFAISDWVGCIARLRALHLLQS